MFNRTLIFFLVCVGLGVFGAYTLVPAWTEYQKTKRELQQEQHQLLLEQRENEHLRERIHMLKTDDRTVERVAREKFNYVRPNETIYDFTEPLPEPTTSQ